MSEFIPGPWKSHCDYLDPDGDIVGECSVGKIAQWGGFYIAVIHDDVPEGEREATANVIAAAPELYEALTICKNKLIEYADADEDANLNGSGCFSDPRQFVGSSVDIAEQAINKADGKP